MAKRPCCSMTRIRSVGESADETPSSKSQTPKKRKTSSSNHGRRQSATLEWDPVASMKSVLIVGGGVIGLCTAYYAAGKGHRVTVVDRAPAEYEGCSYGNAGM